jgi:hypothetical protein
VGNAAIGERDVGELEGAKGKLVVDADLENAPLCLMLCLWNERNAHNFEDCETGLINLKKLVIQTLFMRRVTIQSISECSYSDFLDMCSFSLD